ncbi:unnamed protein product [Oppiella nova]|uniref:Deoxynucleoside kinase domain-containing protein n=1 Tax=Oppiella nova TaxID=334625 RepID=A0A7R9LB40_9ACAR|nr:unnamed protein product [Oppiella nova]CAG2161771.1 unnamed protein product [Oppiella nova]
MNYISVDLYKPFQPLANIYKSLLLVSEGRGYRNGFYAVWLVSTLPLIHIVLNDITAQMVKRDVAHVDTIDDLLDDRLTVYTSYWNNKQFNSPGYYNLLPDEFRGKFLKMISKLADVELGDVLTYFTESSTSFYRIMKNIALIANDFEIGNLVSILGAFTTLHLGQPDLLIPITTLCHGANYPFDNITLVWFEWTSASVLRVLPVNWSHPLYILAHLCPHIPRLVRKSSALLSPQLTSQTITSTSMSTITSLPPKSASKSYTTIAIEGNVGSGKTTFLTHLQTFNDDTRRLIQCFAEPIDKWRSVRGVNLFSLLNEDINRWCFPFQSYVQLSMLQMHQTAPTDPEVAIKLMERSLHSARYCFVENLFRRQHLRREEYAILDEWFQWIVRYEPSVGIDLIIYLRTDPEVAFERILRRNRPEEKNLTLDYLKDLHHLHEEWLLGRQDSTFAIPAPVIVIDANQDLAEVKRVYDRHSVDILNGNAFKPIHNVCKQY